MSTRLPNWRRLMADAIAQRRKTPLVWGASDCCLSIADIGIAFTGQDFAAPLRGYSTRFGALRALKRAGFASLAEYLDSIFPRATRASAGDAVVIPGDPLGPLMLADGRGAAWGQDADGLRRFPIPPNALIWSV